jgi:hypothetical protein
MIIASAIMALVLKTAPSQQAVPIHSIVVSHPGAYGAVGRLLPIERQKLNFGNFQDQIYATELQLAAANPDLDEIIPGFTGDGSAQPARPPQPTSTPPSYESWDVLRQYPHAAPLAQPAQPSTAATKPQDTSKTVKESKDAQGKTATE